MEGTSMREIIYGLAVALFTFVVMRMVEEDERIAAAEKEFEKDGE
jgi:hypothetical protein